MNTPARILRADFGRVDPSPPRFTPRQRERHDRILLAGRVLMARHGRANISFGAFGKALRIGTATLAWHFTDLDDLLGAILRAHLRAIQHAIFSIPESAPGSRQSRARSVRALTHTEAGEPTEAQTLLIRDLALLPDDVRLGLEATLADIEKRLGTSLLCENVAKTVPAPAPAKPQSQSQTAPKPLPSPLLHALQTGTHLRPVSPSAIEEWLGTMPPGKLPPAIAARPPGRPQARPPGKPPERLPGRAAHTAQFALA